MTLIDLPFGDKEIEKFMTKENGGSCKQRRYIYIYIKEIKISSMSTKFDGNLLDFRDENGRMCCCVDVYYREKREMTDVNV